MLATQKNKDVIEQIKKLSQRIDNLNETKIKLFEYLLKTQQMFASNSKTIKNEVENFEDAITKKSFYSIGKCRGMKKLVNIYKHMLTFIEGVAKLNESQLKKIDIGSTRKQDNLKKKLEGFTKVVGQYNYSEQGYNKNFGEYQNLCGKLDEIMGKFKSFESPINFYNLHMASDFSKSLDRKYYECENKETSLISLLQFLDEKRKLLTQSLRDIKQDYVILLNSHMLNITKAATCLTDFSKDDLHDMSGTIAIQKTEGDVFNEQIQRFDTKYGKGNARQDETMFTDLKDLFATKNVNNYDVRITSDERLFLDRCQTFSQKKYESVEEFMYLQKRFVEQIETQIQNCQKINKQFGYVEKNVFRSNGAEDFKKKTRKYFGQGILNVTELCFIIVDVPRRRFEKIGKILQSHQEKLRKLLQKKQEELKKLKKRITTLLSQHNNAAQSIQNNAVSICQYKSNIEGTFSIFKNLFDQFTRNQSEVDRDFEDIIMKIISFIQRQSSHCLLKYTLNKEKEKFLYNIFKNFNSDSEIVQIVKQDTRYEVLFNEPLKPSLFDEFKTQIEKKKFEQTKKVLHKRQYQSKGMIGQREIGCCGMQSSRIRKYTKITDHAASLVYDNQTQKPGKLEILNKGITFQEKRKNPFAQKVQIIIPTKQIISFTNKVSHEGIQGIQILTNMGPIFFFSDQVNEIEESLQKNLSKGIMTKNQVDSKKDKSNDSSSFMKQNNTSTQYKISFQRSVLGNETKSILNNKFDKKNSFTFEMNPFKKLNQVWKTTKVLSDFYTIKSTQEAGGYIRTDYDFKDNLHKFLLKERRSLKASNPLQNFLYINYQWKVSFPEMSMLKSFRHGEEIRIQLTKTVVKIIIIEQNRGESHLFVRKAFYNEVDKMNKRLSDLVVEVCERQGEVIIEQQKPDIDDSMIILDIENLALDKDQIYQKGVKRIPSSSVGIQSQKSTIKMQSQDY